MIDRKVIRGIIVDNIDVIRELEVIPRDIDIEDNVPMIITGIRRGGKSFILYQQMRYLVTQGADWDDFLYINFEDERLIGFGVEDFQSLIEEFYFLNQKKPIIFLDEIQNVEGWEKYARRIADEKRDVYLTGSNAAMLSKEIESTLGGRYVSKHLLPYNFKEFLRAKKVEWDKKDLYSITSKAKLLSQFEEYYQFGGFPEVVNLKDKRSYLSSIYNKIFLGDIVMRYNITNASALEVIVKKIAESVGQPITYTRIRNILQGIGVRVGTSTVINYLEYVKESYLLYEITNFAGKFVEKETKPKYYFVDTGILNLFLYDFATAALENSVAMFLISKYGIENVYYYMDGVEVDFYIPSESLAVQVSYSISDIKTKEREIHSLKKLSNYKSVEKNLIVTKEEEGTIEEDGIVIEVVSAYKWMLS